MRPSPALVGGAIAVVVVAAAVGVYLSRTPPAATTTRADAPDAGHEPAPSALLPRIAERERTDPRPDILLFTIDTLRADHLSGWRYGRATSPAMDALADRGTHFDRAYSTASWTLPAMASLVTGVLPSQHGVLNSRVASDVRAEQDAISPELPSLVQTLHDAGYHTVGLTTNTHLLAETGFSRGFDDYECTNVPSSEDIRGRLWPRLDDLRSSDRPYFLWVHITDPHLPYLGREPYFTRWWGEGRPTYDVLDRAIFVGGIEHPFRVAQVTDEEGLEYVTARYDSEIRAADDFFRDVLGELDDGHLAVFITADHGEELHDHGQMGHGTTLFEEVIHVPMIASVPGIAPSFVTDRTSILDVFPTLVEIAGAPRPAGIAGVSLLPAMRGEPIPARDIVLESGRNVPVQGIVDDRFTYAEVVGDDVPPAVRGLRVLYDLENDPFEQHECRAEHPEIADEMQTRLHADVERARALRPTVPVAAIPIPDEIAERLRQLGYGN